LITAAGDMLEPQNELLRIALALKKESEYFSEGWNINFLQAFIRDRGNCVYCGRDVMKEFCLAQGDHVLPRQIYPALAQNVTNLVPACAHCNRMKSYYDPSEGKGMEVILTDELRRQFIEKSKEEIKRKQIAYERDFQTGDALFNQAIADYRRHAESFPISPCVSPDSGSKIFQADLSPSAGTDIASGS
jgi:HNH endonuclease